VPDLYCHPLAQGWVAELLSAWQTVAHIRECLVPPAEAPRPLLWAAPEHLELRLQQGREAGAWIRVDEVRRRAGQASELLKACGLRSAAGLPAVCDAPGQDASGQGQTRPRVLDAMGGWGLDALLLAAAGALVTSVERQPLLHLLQLDLVRRAQARQVEPVLGDGFDYLVPAHGFDVIYLDPMFPTRNKRALPGKHMQYLTALLTETTLGNALERPLERWVEHAVQSARLRVVVKRRLHDRPIVAPDWQIRGRSIRYDVFRGRALSAQAAPPGESRDR
jgi:16S rRNA (guanine1516-N2)-methyltransferase